MSRNTWLPVSAQEWADSATIEADPEMIAATVLARATHRFAPNAISTVRALSPPGIDTVTPSVCRLRSASLVRPSKSRGVRVVVGNNAYLATREYESRRPHADGRNNG
jgi:hypothetical protein